MMGKFKRMGSRHGTLIMSLLLNAFFLIASLVLCRTRFETGVDRDISNLLAGVYSDGALTIPFVNAAFCRAVAWLFRVTNYCVNWYVLICVALSFVSMTALCRMLMRRAGRSKMGFVVCLMVVAWLSRSHYVVFNYVRNAALYTSCGALLLLDGLYSRRGARSWPSIVTGAALVVAGSLLCFRSLWLALPVFALAVICETVAQMRRGRLFARLGERLPAVVALVCCAAIVIGFHFWHARLWQTDPRLSGFAEVYARQQELLAADPPDYNDNRDAIRAAGLSRDDYYLMTRQTFLDRDVYTEEAWDAVAGLQGRRSGFSTSAIVTAARKVVGDLGSDRTALLFWLCAAALLIYYFACTDMRHLPLMLLAALLLVAQCCLDASAAGGPSSAAWYGAAVPLVLLCAYYAILDNHGSPETGRIDPRAVRRIGLVVLAGVCAAVAGLMLSQAWYAVVVPCIALCALIALKRGEPTPPADADDGGRMPFNAYSLRYVACAVLALAGIAALLGQIGAGKADARTYPTDEYSTSIRYAQSRQNTMFLFDRPTVDAMTESGYTSAWQTFDRGSHDNIAFQGGWIGYTPENLGVLERFGVRNPYQSIVTGARTIILEGSEARLKLQYMRKHYTSGVMLDRISGIGKADLYQFNLTEPYIDPLEAVDGQGVIASKIVLARDYEANTVDISGYAYRDGDDSMDANLYMGVVRTDGTEAIFQLNKGLRDGDPEITNGRYGAFHLRINIPKSTRTMSLYYLSPDGQLYRMPVNSLHLRDINNLHFTETLPQRTSINEYELNLKEDSKVYLLFSRVADSDNAMNDGAYWISLFDAEGALIDAYAPGDDPVSAKLEALPAGVYRVTVQAGERYSDTAYDIMAGVVGSRLASNKLYHYTLTLPNQIITRRFNVKKAQRIEFYLDREAPQTPDVPADAPEDEPAGETDGMPVQLIVSGQDGEMLLRLALEDGAASTCGQIDVPEGELYLTIIAPERAVQNVVGIYGSVLHRLDNAGDYEMLDQTFIRNAGFRARRDVAMAFEISHEPDSDGRSEYVVAVHDADCNVIAEMTLNGTDSLQRAFAFLPKGRYHALVTVAESFSDAPYLLTRSEIDTDMHFDEPYAGTLADGADVAYYYIRADEAGTVDVKLRREPGEPGAGRLTMSLYDSKGLLSTLQAGESTQSASQTVRLEPGSYFIAVSRDVEPAEDGGTEARPGLAYELELSRSEDTP